MTSYTLRSASPAKTRVDAVVVGVVSTRKGVEIAPGGEDVAAAWGRSWRPLVTHLGIKATPGSVTTLPTTGRIKSPLLVLVGLGAASEVDQIVVRRAAGVAARAVPNAASLALALPADEPALVRAALEGFVLGGYRFTAYKSARSTDKAPTEVVVLAAGARRREFVDAFNQAQVVTDAIRVTRDWVNTPPADLTPPKFAEAVAAEHKMRAKGRTKQLTMTVHDEEALAELGFGGTLGVGQGSDAPPRLVEVRWTPADPVAHLAFVGKGVTFDSGGLAIKPAASMPEMKCDMAGAAAVLMATYAIAALDLPVQISAFAPMAENMISGTSFRPGDVLSVYGGQTVEIRNPDAEGRLLLADALVLAGEQEPDLMVDVATLTGAMHLALGDKVAGVLGTDAVVDEVLAAGRAAGEALWPMPITEEVVERVDASPIADVLQSDLVRWGGGLYAAAFLQRFVGDMPWGHLDIAGPAFNSGGAYGHVASGGTGFAVATLVELARARAAR